MKTFSYGLVSFCLTRTPIGWLKLFLRARVFQLKPYLTPPTSFDFRVVFSTYSSFSTFLAVILYSLRFYEFRVSLSNFILKSFSESRSYSFSVSNDFRVSLSTFYRMSLFSVAFSSFVFRFCKLIL